MGALPPLETPTRKGDMLPLHGAHTAFSCYPALRLYWLSKSQRGIGVVSLSKWTPGFPLWNGLPGHLDFGSQLFLGESFFLSQGNEFFLKGHLFHSSLCQQAQEKITKFQRQNATNKGFQSVNQG